MEPVPSADADQAAATEIVPGTQALLLAEAQAGLLVLQDGCVRYANPAAVAMLGWTLQTLLGRPQMRLVASEDRGIAADQIQRCLAGEVCRPYDVRCSRRDSSQFDARISGRLIPYGGRPAVLATLTDVSELKEAVRRIERDAANLLARSEALSGSGSFELEWPSGRLKPSQGLLALVGHTGECPHDVTVARIPWVPDEERAHVAGIWLNATPGDPFEFQHFLVCADGRRLVVLHRGLLEPPEPGESGAQRGIAFVQDVTRQRDAERRIQELAHFDEVTGLPNRANLLDRVDAEMHPARWEELELGLLSIDVPRIAEVKTTMGFGAGDTVAMAVAARLRQCCSGEEYPAHLGDTEFAVLLPLLKGEAQEVLRERARAIRTALQPPVPLAGTDVQLTCDMGLAVFPGDADGASALLEAAQSARSGSPVGGAISFFRRETTAQAMRELQLEAALRHAIARGELRLLYQPQVNLHSGQIAGVEALLRWKSAEWGDVSPAEFVPLAERCGLIGAIGDWVLREACTQSVQWAASDLPPVRVGVNFSPQQFLQGNVAQQVQAALVETGADPGRLGIEITESTLMADIGRASEMLRELKSIGVEISLDDFGTGYSSLNHLCTLPLDIVKVDRSFVHDVTAAPASVSVTRAIITMAHSLQLRVLAEGVETPGQAALLATNGCDLIQGYLFSPAVSAEEFEVMLCERRALPDSMLRRRDKVRTLLLVDDEDNIVSSLKRLFRRDGYQIVTANGGAEGLQRLAEHEVDVIVSDQRMPGMTGVEFLHRAKALYPDTVRMTLSGFTDLQSIIDAVNEGAIYKFLTKPWEDDLLRAHVAEAFRQKEMVDDNRRLAGEVATANADLAKLNTRLEHFIDRQRSQTQMLVANAGHTRDMLDALPVAVFGVDADGMVAYVNEEAVRVLLPSRVVLGDDAASALPAAVSAALSQCGATNVTLSLMDVRYRVLCAPLGVQECGADRGKLLLLVPHESA